MSVNGITNVTSNIQTAYSSYDTTGKAKEAESKSEVAEEAAAVYEKSDDSQTASTKKTYTPNTELVNKLKADMAQQQANLQNIVQKMLGKQATSFANANDMWQFLAKGDFEVDAETKAQAQEDISEDGYWGVKQTSERILDFATALTGGDPDKIESMREAFKKGYAQAEKTWGGELPDISKQTYDAVMKGFDKLAGIDETTATEA